MKETAPAFKKMLFVCVKERKGKEACASAGSERLLRDLKDGVKDRKLSRSVRVMQSGCHDCCSKGPSVLLFPDALHFTRVQPKDVARILAIVEARLQPAALKETHRNQPES